MPHPDSLAFHQRPLSGPGAFGGGGTYTTVIWAEAVLPVKPSPGDLIGRVVLIFTPGVIPVTLTTIVQVAPGNRPLPPPLNSIASVLSKFRPKVTMPSQVLLMRRFGVDTASPSGRSSSRTGPRTVAALGFEMVKARVVEPYWGILSAPKAMLSTGGLTAASACVVTSALAIPRSAAPLPLQAPANRSRAFIGV